MPGIGQLRTLLTIETQEAGDGYGREVPKWKKFAQAWFELKDGRGEETDRAQQTHGKVNYIGTCRWFAGAHSQMRLTDGHRVLHVESVVNDRGQNRWLIWRLVESN